MSCFYEGIGESKLGAWECRFGGVEVAEQLLNCSVGAGIGQRMNTDLQHLGVAVWDDVCVGSKQVAKQRAGIVLAAKRFTE